MKKKEKNIIVGYHLGDLIWGIISLVLAIVFILNSNSSSDLHHWIMTLVSTIGAVFLLWKFVNPKNKFISKNSKEAEQIGIERLKHNFSTIKIRDYSNLGFKIIREGNISEAKWNNIKKIILLRTEIFKKDEFYLFIFLDKGKASSFEISETSEDWTNFIEKLIQRFPQIDKEWQKLYSDLPSNEIGPTIYKRNKNVG